MLISSNPTSSVKYSSVTDADAVGIIRTSAFMWMNSHREHRGHRETINYSLCPLCSLWLKVFIHRNFNSLPPVESLPPPPDFPARSCRRGLRPGTRRGLRGASLWRCASSAMTRRNRFFRGATVCPIPLRRVLSTPPLSYRLPSPPESTRRRRRAPSLSIHRGRRWRRLL